VYSTEVPGEVKLLPLPEEEFQKGSVKELQAFDDFRVRILPVLGAYAPLIFVFLILTREQAPYPRSLASTSRPTFFSMWRANPSSTPRRSRTDENSTNPSNAVSPSENNVSAISTFKSD